MCHYGLIFSCELRTLVNMYDICMSHDKLCIIYELQVKFLANPRNEDAENELDGTNNKFINFLYTYI